MTLKHRLVLATLLFCLFSFRYHEDKIGDERFLSFVADPHRDSIAFYWKNDHGQPLRSIQNLKTFIEQKGKQLKFAMNGGMFQKDNAAQGLFIQNQIIMQPIDTTSGTGNFYMKPNGIFYITTKNEAFIKSTSDFLYTGDIKFATQSGPMLLVNGNIHPMFKNGSSNLNIRNGVGILPDNRMIFAMSKQQVNFYDFAEFFRKQGCKNALYLDGFVSRMFLPEKHWEQLDGNFGVIIAVTE
jgi:uncharacterized protein YigE (DUF2233 family)